MNNNLDWQYKNLLQTILDYGVEKQTRNGGTKSIFGYTIRHDMKGGFPLLTTKKMAWKQIVTELLWFLRGDTNIKYLVDNDCHIWDGDCFSNYEKWFWDNVPPKADTSGKLTKEQFIEQIKTDDEFAKKWGELGPIYGRQWRSWTRGKQQYKNEEGKFWLEFDHYDQIKDLIEQLKHNPDSRRLMVSAWNVGELYQMVLPPCHYGFQVYTRELSIKERLDWTKLNHPNIVNEKGWLDLYSNFEEAELWFSRYDIGKAAPKRAISLMWNQRSVDTFLGLPFNIASYGLLLEIIAKEVNMIPDQLIGSFGDVHLYSNHVEQAKEQINRESFNLPKLKMNPIFLANLEHKGLDEAINGQVNFELENYQSHPAIKAPLSN